MITLRGQSPVNTPGLLNPATGRIGEDIVEGDWLLAIVTTGANFASSQKLALPPGWTWLLPLTTPGTAGTGSFAVAAHRRLPGEVSYQFSVTPPTAAEVSVPRIVLLWGSGAGDARDWKIGPRWVRETVDTRLARAQSIMTTRAGSTVLAFAFDRTIAAETEAQVTTVWGDATRLIFGAISDQTFNIVQRDFPTAGTATGEAVTTYPNPHPQNGLGFQVETSAVGPIPAPQPPVTDPGMAVRVAGQAGTARLKVATAGGLATPKAHRAVPYGYKSVTAMLQQEFYIAHRGGSRDYPEMSIHGYGQSALKGYGALELSLARTSDGVWFGLHDDSIDRTSGVVTGKLASQMTWVEVQQYQILASITSNGTQPNRPYMRWEELMALYYATHVILIDPKAAMSFRVELLDLMDAQPGNPRERFVGKYYGVSGGNPEQADSFPRLLKNRGYQSWGYFYESDMPNFAAYQGRWSILGMDHRAPQAAWDAIKTYGKPVIGHIAATQAAVTTAKERGASGYMVAGTRDVIPTRAAP